MRRFIASLLLLIIAAACEKGNYEALERSVESARFCSYVENEEFDSTGKLVKSFLKQPGKTGQAGLESLAAWLDDMDCVAQAEVLCNSCIKTNPPQSELVVHFLTNNDTTRLIMDVYMDEPLRFFRYHE